MKTSYASFAVFAGITAGATLEPRFTSAFTCNNTYALCCNECVADATLGLVATGCSAGSNAHHNACTGSATDALCCQTSVPLLEVGIGCTTATPDPPPAHNLALVNVTNHSQILGYLGPLAQSIYWSAVTDQASAVNVTIQAPDSNGYSIISVDGEQTYPYVAIGGVGAECGTGDGYFYIGDTTSGESNVEASIFKAQSDGTYIPFWTDASGTVCQAYTYPRDAYFYEDYFNILYSLDENQAYQYAEIERTYVAVFKPVPWAQS